MLEGEVRTSSTYYLYAFALCSLSERTTTKRLIIILDEILVLRTREHCERRRMMMMSLTSASTSVIFVIETACRNLLVLLFNFVCLYFFS